MLTILKGLRTRTTFLVLCALLYVGCDSGDGDTTAPPAVARGDLIVCDDAGTVGPDTADSVLSACGLVEFAPARYGCDLWRITYRTIDINGQTTTGSGMLVLPSGATGDLPTISWQHGTSTLKTGVPSRSDDEVYLAACLFASAGYAVVSADYLGMGDSPGPHPYLHASSEASACVDMLRAVRHAVAGKGVSLDGPLFLAGYSQGGHATMALQRELERNAVGEFRVTAAAPMAGPYDMSGTMFPAVLGSTNPNAVLSVCVPYMLHAYDYVYGVYHHNAAEAFVAPYDVLVPHLFDGNHDIGEIQSVLPSVAPALFKPEFLAAVAADSQHPLNVALRDNDVYDWRPQAPVHLYHSRSDDVVPFRNSEIAATRMNQLGGNVQLINVGDGLDHGSAALSAYAVARAWFDSLK